MKLLTLKHGDPLMRLFPQSEGEKTTLLGGIRMASLGMRRPLGPGAITAAVGGICSPPGVWGAFNAWGVKWNPGI